jgi:hypothetical protein
MRAAPVPTPTRSPSMRGGGGGGGGGGGAAPGSAASGGSLPTSSFALASSLDRRQLEREYVKRVVERAEEELVDVMEAAADVEREDPFAPAAAAYAASVRALPLNAPAALVPRAGSLAAAAAAASKPGEAVAAHARAGADRDALARVDRLGARIVAGMEAAHVLVVPEERLVATFASM